MKRLGVDYGIKRIGLAFADNTVVVPLETIEQNDSELVSIEKIVQCAIKYQVNEIIVGMPYTFTGGDTDQTAITKKFVSVLTAYIQSKQLPLEVKIYDEKLTSQISDRWRNSGADRGRDELSALALLQSYIEWRSL